MNSLADNRIDVGRELQKALSLHKAGHLGQAEKIYCRILEIAPGHADALHLQGLVYVEQGALPKAKACIRRAIKADNCVPVFYVSFGDILQREGESGEAANYYHKALQLNPAMVEALCNLGNALREQGNDQQAIICYQKCIRLNPQLPQVYNNLGIAYQKLKNPDSAEICFKKAISLNSRYVEAINNLGNLYRDISNFDAAIEQYQQALVQAPENTTVNYNLGALYQSRNMVDEAIGYFQKAIDHHPPNADAYSNLGKYYQDRNQPDQAIYHFDRAIELDPDHYDAHFNRSLSLLATGNFEDGWKAYEWRFQREDWRRVYPHQLKGLRWDGRDFEGKTLLIHCEQGFGDTIWLVRYLSLVKSLRGTVIFETRYELVDLMENFPGVDQLVPMSIDESPRIAYDFYIPLMSLPLVLATTLESIPANVPYLSSSAEKRDYWKSRIGGAGPKIGLVWAAKSTNEHDRSCPLDEFGPLFALRNAQFYGLQKGEDENQADNFPADIINLGPKFVTFADTAGAIESLDLVISVDTAVAHLVGAMGKPVWLVLPYAADWKWLMERQDSPWYPTMRLFRQPRPGDWTAVVNVVADQLKQWIDETLY